MLLQLGKAKWAVLWRRSLVLVASVFLHGMVCLLLGRSEAGDFRLAAATIEAEVLPAAERILPDPPSYPQVELRAASMVDIPLLQVAIDESVEPVAATQAIDTRDLADSQPPATNASAGEPPEVDSYPFTRPRPVSGPRGVDRFPSASLQAKESGTVRINICVSTSGTVDSVEVTSSSGFPRLDRAALGIASEYRFKPAMRRGHPVAACAQYNIIFKVT